MIARFHLNATFISDIKFVIYDNSILLFTKLILKVTMLSSVLSPLYPALKMT